MRELTFHVLAEGKGERSPMHPHAPFVVNEPPFAKAVHEEAHSRARRADYLRESLLVHFQHHGLRSGLPSRTGQQQKNSRESLFAGMQNLIHEVFLDSDINTTTSMGRLTLNVLLSFAQFAKGSDRGKNPGQSRGLQTVM